MVELLVEAGADVNALDNNGYTAIDAVVLCPEVDPEARRRITSHLRGKGGTTGVGSFVYSPRTPPAGLAVTSEWPAPNYDHLQLQGHVRIQHRFRERPLTHGSLALPAASKPRRRRGGHHSHSGRRDRLRGRPEHQRARHRPRHRQTQVVGPGGRPRFRAQRGCRPRGQGVRQQGRKGNSRLRRRNRKRAVGDGHPDERRRRQHPTDRRRRQGAGRDVLSVTTRRQGDALPSTSKRATCSGRSTPSSRKTCGAARTSTAAAEPGTRRPSTLTRGCPTGASPTHTRSRGPSETRLCCWRWSFPAATRAGLRRAPYSPYSNNTLSMSRALPMRTAVEIMADGAA